MLRLIVEGGVQYLKPNRHVTGIIERGSPISWTVRPALGCEWSRWIDRATVDHWPGVSERYVIVRANGVSGWAGKGSFGVPQPRNAIFCSGTDTNEKQK